MQPVTGPGMPPRGQPATPPGPDQPLSTAQRTNLERLINRIMVLSNSKAAEIWAALCHQLNISNDGELRVRHLAPAEQLLLARLHLAEETLAGRQLRQRLSDLLPQGNNRQAVSNYIRSQFGHTVLGQLDAGQLRQVLSLLQSGRLDIPAPQHHAISQLIIRLAAVSGESPADLWQSIFSMMGLKSGDPIPARHFPLLSQFLQGHLTLSQHSAPTLAILQAVLKHPTVGAEQQAVENYCRQHFAADSHTPLTAAQVSAVMQYLFIYRLSRTQSQHQTPDSRLLQPVTHPLIVTENPHRPAKAARSPLVTGLLVAVALVIIWLLAH